MLDASAAGIVIDRVVWSTVSRPRVLACKEDACTDTETLRKVMRFEWCVAQFEAGHVQKQMLIESHGDFFSKVVEGIIVGFGFSRERVQGIKRDFVLASNILHRNHSLRVDGKKRPCR